MLLPRKHGQMGQYGQNDLGIVPKQDLYGSDTGTLAHVEPTQGHYWSFYFPHTYHFVLVTMFIKDTVCFISLRMKV